MPLDPMLKEKEIIIPYAHLSYGAQRVIGDPKRNVISDYFASDVDHLSIRQARISRAFSDDTILLSIGGAIKNLVAKEPQSPYTAIGAAGGVGIRQFYSCKVQQVHEHLISEMSRHGVLNTEYEGHYPYDWMKPGVIKETHPVMFVDRKGNVHFLKDNWREYARYKFQKTKAGALGLNMWRWRAYLRPPRVPEKVKDKVNRQVAQLAQALAPQPQLAPVRVGARYRAQQVLPTARKRGSGFRRR